MAKTKQQQRQKRTAFERPNRKQQQIGGVSYSNC